MSPSPESTNASSPQTADTEASRTRANTMTSEQSSQAGIAFVAVGQHAPQNTPAHSVAGSIAAPNGTLAADFPQQLKLIQEETPGQFFEDPSGVPDSSPIISDPGDDTAMLHRSSTEIDLPALTQRLEQLPPLGASVPTSPQASVVPESSIGEPLMMHPVTRDQIRAGPRTTQITSLGQFLDADTREVGISSTVQAITTLDGVREHNDWSGDVQQDFARNLFRLSNLAEDDHQRDDSKTADEHYRHRLSLLLNRPDTRYPYGNVNDVPRPDVDALARDLEFKLLEKKVESLMEELKRMKADIRILKGEEAATIKAPTTDVIEVAAGDE